MLIWQILVLGSGRILNYSVKKEKVRTEDGNKEKSPTQFYSREGRLMAAPPFWNTASETKSLDMWCEICIEALAPQHNLQGKFYWNCYWRRKQKPKNIPATKVRIWHSHQCPWECEERTQEWDWFSSKLESLGCFSSCSTCLKVAKVLALQMIPLPLTTSGYRKHTVVVPQCPWELVPGPTEDNKIHRWSSPVYKIA